MVRLTRILLITRPAVALEGALVDSRAIQWQTCLFLPFLSKTIKDTQKEFDKMSLALKQQAEQLQIMRQA
ncbi:MAG: hypothetical protein ABSF82_12900 [Candidatus Bathyarchaeia archaeon]